MATAQIQLNRKPSAAEKLKIRAALGGAAWVIRVDFRDDEPHVEHNSDDTDANMHYSRLHLMAKLKETVPGLAVNE